MTHMKFILTMILPIMIAGISSAQATDILAPPTIIPLDQNYQAWDHPSATVIGEGELKFKDESANIPVKVRYEGTITCTVSASANTGTNNELEIKPEDVGNEIDAKSKVGSFNISDCSVNGAAIADSAALTGKVKIEIEGFYENSGGILVFDAYEAEGKVENGTEVKLELENGSITLTPTPPPGSGGGGTIPPVNGGGGGVL